MDSLLKTLRTYLHLGTLDREPVIFPVVPPHSCAVNTIQIGFVARIVPPAAFALEGTVEVAGLIIIMTPGRK